MYIGVSKDRALHALSVAKKMKELAEDIRPDDLEFTQCSFQVSCTIQAMSIIVTVQERLNDVKERYDEESFQYLDFFALAKNLDLVQKGSFPCMRTRKGRHIF